MFRRWDHRDWRDGQDPVDLGAPFTLTGPDMTLFLGDTSPNGGTVSAGFWGSVSGGNSSGTTFLCSADEEENPLVLTCNGVDVTDKVAGQADPLADAELAVQVGEKVAPECGVAPTNSAPVVNLGQYPATPSRIINRLTRTGKRMALAIQPT